MKKMISMLCGILLVALSVSTAYAASVTPQLFPGNDSNPADYQPPSGYIHYEIPNSSIAGTHVATFNKYGAADPGGQFTFTVVVGTEVGQTYTSVLSWTSNFPLYAVIVQGDDAFNLYQYNFSLLSDTNLVAPDITVGQPADVNHVSIVFNPVVLNCGTSCAIGNIIFAIILFSFLGIIVALLIVIILKMCILVRPPQINIIKKGDTDIDFNILNKETNIDVKKETNVDINNEANIDINKNINIYNEHDCHKWKKPDNPCK